MKNVLNREVVKEILGWFDLKFDSYLDRQVEYFDYDEDEMTVEDAKKELIADLTADGGEGSLYDTIAQETGVNEYLVEKYGDDDSTEEVASFRNLVDGWLMNNNYRVG